MEEKEGKGKLVFHHVMLVRSGRKLHWITLEINTNGANFYHKQLQLQVQGQIGDKERLRN